MSKSERLILFGLLLFIILNTTPKGVLGIPMIDSLWRLGVATGALILCIAGVLHPREPP